MIPRAHITAWKSSAPWPAEAQVEQDLVATRAISEVFSSDFLRERLAFRGATALYKLFFDEAPRYSEDIDFVQRIPEPIGPTLDAIRGILDPWLGQAEWDQGERGTRLTYRFESEYEPIQPLRLKVEINTREHVAAFVHVQRTLSAENPWFSGEVPVTTYELDELMGTKMRALYQRRQGRDLFDLWYLITAERVDPERVVEAFTHYLTNEGHAVSRAEFEENLFWKREDARFREDVLPLLRAEVRYSFDDAIERVLRDLIARLPGESWRGEGD